MKKILLVSGLLLLTSVVFAQDEKENNNENTGGFKKENVYIGGGINLGGGNGSFSVGVLPEVGYSITKWLDGGISFNVNYQTQRIEDPYTGSVYAKYRATTYGGGVFLRIWPVNFLHVTIQPEYNWIKVNMIDVNSNQKSSATYKAESLLVGVGYGSREVGRQLSYLTIMIDLAKNLNSPYRDQYNHAQPVFRTGIGFYLKPSRK
jgi:hypothetical protein